VWESRLLNKRESFKASTETRNRDRILNDTDPQVSAGELRWVHLKLQKASALSTKTSVPRNRRRLGGSAALEREISHGFKGEGAGR